MYVNSIRIQTESSVKRPLVWTYHQNTSIKLPLLLLQFVWVHLHALWPKNAAQPFQHFIDQALLWYSICLHLHWCCLHCWCTYILPFSSFIDFTAMPKDQTTDYQICAIQSSSSTLLTVQAVPISDTNNTILCDTSTGMWRPLVPPQ